MERVRTWVAGAVVGLLLLPGAGTASAGPVPAASLAAALPTPTAAQPRLGFVDTSDELRRLNLSTDGGGIGIAAAGAQPEAAAGTGSPAVLAAATQPDLGTVPPIFAFPDRQDFSVRDGHRVDGQAHVTTLSDSDSLVAWVSTQDVEEPDPGGAAAAAAAGPDETDVRTRFGDVYVNTIFSGTPGPDIRITCDAAQEVHPVVSPGGHHVAYASNASGRWVVMVAEVPPAGDGSCEAAAPEAVTADDVDSTWPTWLDDGHLIVSQTNADAPLGALYRIDLGATRLDPVQLTSGDVGSTQPDVRSTGKAEAFLLAYTTTAYRPDGSIQFMQLDDDGRPVQRVDGEGEPMFDPDGNPLYTIDPYQGAESSRVQGSEPAWAPGSAFDLLFTSTQDDPAGGVWVGVWDTGNPPQFQGERSLVDVVGVTESHPTWILDYDEGESSTDFADLAYTSEVVSADVTDVVADDGSDVRPVSAEGFFPSGDTLSSFAEAGAGVHYSPDGTQVAYSTPVGGEGDTGMALTLARADDLTDVPFDYDRDDDDIDVDPVWSPDGTSIVFVRAASDGDGGHQPPHLWLVSVKPDGTFGETRQLTQSEAVASRWDTGPTWSPDGTHVAFSRISRFGSDNPTASEIWAVDVATGEATQVILSECGCGGLAVFGRSPSWSPDGTQLAIADLVTDIPADSDLAIDARGAIGLVTLAPGDVTRVVAVAPLTGFDRDGNPTAARLLVDPSDDPEWSPDGTEITFSGSPAGQARLRAIWGVTPDAATVREVVDLSGPQRAPAYQPFTDLVLTMSAGPVAGGAATVTATVSNTGPALVRDGTVTVELPAGLTTPGAPGCTQSAALVTCALTDPLPAGQTVAFAIPVQGISDTTRSTIPGTVQTGTPERVVTNNTASVDVGGAGGVGVTLALSSPVAFVGGRPVTATFTVRNAGALPAQDVALATTYPGIVTVAPSGGAPCLVAAGVCPIGTLAGGAAVVLTATLDPTIAFTGPPQTGPVTGTVTTTSPDPGTGDNTATATLEVRQPVVVLAPAVARPNEVVFAVGHDFPPGEDVDLGWSSGLLSVRNPVVVRPDGSWSQSILIIRDTLLTRRDLRVTDGQPSPTFGDVQAPLLVVPTSVDAPTFLFRK
ncbi:hypothetical protein Cch01nite_27240 [Cellulomonas chitinilytica]|uniref:DUF11 domain-containing protein n=1 Tax=Cellulomonas chitinilytica TaxID=398759 RepID=A0A919P3F4_9CELL|nr:DUF11 domain-containing protein [Cellulomonas chitinilytica]GIG22000.1 hypothetical protein Cch01nite_27240 [Cellulomonas chitinilytica]